MPVSQNGTQNSIYRSFADKKLQEFAFRAQIRLALRFNLPLVLHIRDVEDALDGGQAEQNCYRILKSANVPKDYPIHRHCFNGQQLSIHDWRKVEPYFRRCEISL